MTHRRCWISVLAVAALGAGCHHDHLHDDAGRAVRAALSAQRDSAPSRTPTADASQAKRTLAVMRAESSSAAAAPAMTSAAPTAPAASGSGAWPGAQGGIKLEAK